VKVASTRSPPWHHQGGLLLSLSGSRSRGAFREPRTGAGYSLRQSYRVLAVAVRL